MTGVANTGGRIASLNRFARCSGWTRRLKEPWDEPAATYERASDEHGRLAVSAATNRLGLGDKLRLIPGHCDPTVNLYDWYVGIRNNRVDRLWPIIARGAVY